MTQSIEIDTNKVNLVTLESGKRAIQFDISNEFVQSEISLYMQDSKPIKIKWEGSLSFLNVTLVFGENAININKLPIKVLDFLELGEIGFMPLFANGLNMGLIKWPKN